MTGNPKLIIELAGGGAVDQQLSRDPLPSITGGDVVLVRLDADEAGRLEAPEEGQVVLSVASPEALARDPQEVHRVIEDAGTGTQPLVVVVEAADELRDDELDPLLDAAARSPRSVILRIAADG